MEAKKKEIMQMVNECNNERFISFLCSMIKAFKEKWKIADVIELIDTEDITGYIPAEKTDRA